MKFLLIIIIILAAIFRFYNLNWDQDQHLHPDERMITMVADRLTLEDPNPHFFAYGSFPIYLLKVSGLLAGNFNPRLASYDQLNLAGRFLSALFDLGTILILFLLGKKLVNQEVGLLAAFFYTVSVLPIQLAHFYAVDTLLTFFTILTLYLLIRSYDHFNIKNAVLLGVSFGLALATKVSAIVLAIPIVIILIIKFFSKSKFATFYFLFFTFAFLLLTFVLAMPYALLDFSTFLKQTLEQQQMTKSAFTFPYTLQYVGKIPYLYELKNIFLWGLGPVLSSLTFTGTLFFTYKTFRPPHNTYYIILATFFGVYFAIVGSFAIGFMRYMLPLYPLLCLFAAILIWQLHIFLKSKIAHSLFLTFHFSLFTLLLIWPLAFLSIYSQPNTRTLATQWINANIPPGSTIAVEHWDDELPIGTASNYQILTLPLYDPDTPAKWSQINQILDRTQYIIIASNRLYTPLQKLTDCPNLPPGKCYLRTAKYYQQLFNGSLGFSKVAEFSVYPTLSIYHIPYTTNDSSADESFTVYDHPKIMIFKKSMINYQRYEQGIY